MTNDKTYIKDSLCGDTAVINGIQFRMEYLISQGSDSRIYSARSLGSGVDSAFVIKYRSCRVGGEEWDRCMREIEAGQMLRGCSYIVKLLGHSVRLGGEGGAAEIFLLYHRLECLSGIVPTTAETLGMCRDICRALDYMRRKGLIHCDIKPSNIYRSADHWLLGDLGSVCLLGGTPETGSIGYCSPEAYRGERCDIRADLYSLGITCYQQLSGGRLPFCDVPCGEMQEEEVNAVIQRRQSGESIPPIESAGDEVNALLMRMCAFERRRRFRTPRAASRTLEKIIGRVSCL